VHAAALPDDGVALGRQRAAQAPRGIEPAALLLEAHHAQALGALDLPGVGRQRAREEIEEHRLAAAVRADHAQPRAGCDDEIEATDQPAAAE
jgi:hypothetical protein